MATVALLGTCDTKLDELFYIRDRILTNDGVDVILIDVGREAISHQLIDIPQDELVRLHGNDEKASDLARADVINLMASCATKQVNEMHEAGKIHGIVAIGGSGGTSLTAQVMREALPIGFPKLIVSTIASGDTGPLIGETDITLMYSVVDIAGLNRLLRDILSNAGAFIANAARAYKSRLTSEDSDSKLKKRVGVTMFGVTTPGVDAVRHYLESKYDVEVYVFHATGHGGKAMERLIREGRLDAVLDLTTTEICDLITGGVMSAGPSRLEAAAEAGIPNIVSLGAADMTNFGPMSTVPAKYRDRHLHEHNPVVTIMRSSQDESRQVAEHLTKKLLEHAKNRQLVQVWLPTGGVSMLSTPGGPFADANADRVLFSEVKTRLEGSGIGVVEDTRDINDTGFAHDIAEALARLMGLQEGK